MKRPIRSPDRLFPFSRNGVTVAAFFWMAGFLIGRLTGKVSSSCKCDNEDLFHMTTIPRTAVIPVHEAPIKATSHADRSTSQEGRFILKRQLIPPLLLPTLAGISVVTLEPGQRIDRHSHISMHEFFYILSGRAVFEITGSNISDQEQEKKDPMNRQVSSTTTTTVLAQPNTLIHLVPPEKHSIWPDEDEGSSQNLTMILIGITVD